MLCVNSWIDKARFGCLAWHTCEIDIKSTLHSDICPVKHTDPTIFKGFYVYPWVNRFHPHDRRESNPINSTMMMWQVVLHTELRAATWSLKSPKVPFSNTWSLVSQQISKSGP